MKHIRLSTLVIFSLALAACTSASGNTQNGTAQSATQLPIATQLALGSLKLEETQYALTSNQAQELLPMWQVYTDLLTSDTAAQEEIDALIEQIQESMTPEQMQAITDMKLTQQDISSVMQTSTVFKDSSQNSNNTTTSSAGGGQFGGPGDFGGIPPADFGGTGGQGTNTTQQTQNTNTGSSLTNANRVPTALIETLIQMLQQKAAA